jgi:hypothetical protein
MFVNILSGPLVIDILYSNTSLRMHFLLQIRLTLRPIYWFRLFGFVNIGEKSEYGHAHARSAETTLRFEKHGICIFLSK